MFFQLFAQIPVSPSALQRVYTAHTGRYACHHLVGDGAEPLGQLGHGQLRAEDLHFVALLAGDIGDVYHAHIHADITHIAGWPAIHDAVSASVAQAAVQSVGIANGYGGDARWAHQLSSAAVAYGF